MQEYARKGLTMTLTRKHIWILTTIVGISGLNQGLLLPLIALLLEEKGVSSTVNGLHATGVYIGILFASLFMEAPLRKYGFRPLILGGGLTVTLCLLSFPLWDSLLFWFLLRFLIGIGDQTLHFATQTWITAYSPAGSRGKIISLYGLFFGIGFAVGPFFLPLLAIHSALPFLVSAALSLAAILTIFLLENQYPEKSGIETYTIRSTLVRFKKVLALAWAPLLPAFGYGVLEASLNSNFPVYGLRIGLEVEKISLILPAFSIGGIVFQLPLGIMSDKYGRRKVLLTVFALGTVLLWIMGMAETSFLALFFCFFVFGMLLGSAYSLSLAFMTDSIPKQFLPAGNLLSGVCFSFGSISGPLICGAFIQYFQSFSYFHFLSLFLLAIFLGLAKKPAPKPESIQK